MRNLVVCIILSSLLVLCGSCSNAKLYIKNASFENGDSNGKPSDWELHVWSNDPAATSFGVDQNISYSGKSSAYITNSLENHSYYSQRVSIPDKKAIYEISCWFKTENIPADDHGACLTVENAGFSTGDLKGNIKDWKQVFFYVEATQDIHEINIWLGLGFFSGLTKGKVWFDDVTIHEVQSAPTGAQVAFLSNQQPEPEATQPLSNKLKSLLNFFMVFSSLTIMGGIILIVVFLKINKKTKSGQSNEY